VSKPNQQKSTGLPLGTHYTHYTLNTTSIRFSTRQENSD